MKTAVITLSPLFKKVLAYYQITLEEYNQKIALSILPDFGQFFDMEKVETRIRTAIARDEKIFIYGDYDADGICGTAILTYALQKLGAKVDYYIPNRIDDGYGITLKRIEGIIDSGSTLIITVDNGISQVAALNYASQQRIDVIVTDHHLPLGPLSPCYALLHPNLSNYTTTLMSGGFVAYALATTLLKKEVPYLLALAAITTVSDIMPLVNENITLLRRGLAAMNKNSFSKLMSLNNSSNFFSEQSLASPIASRINAVGRLANGRDGCRVVRYLITDNLALEKEDLNLINKASEERKKIVEQTYQRLFSTFKPSNREIEVIVDKEIHEGIIGLVASQMVERFQKTIIVLTLGENGNYKGSCRSDGRVAINQLFIECKDLLIHYGGHALAGGLEISEDKIASFIERLSTIEVSAIEKIDNPAIETNLDEIDFAIVEQILRLGPFGEQNEAIPFVIKGLSRLLFKLSNDGKHVLGSLGDIRFIGFNLGQVLQKHPRSVNIYFNMGITYFGGRKSIELRIYDLEGGNYGFEKIGC